jgi:hypothetical protein
MGQQVTDGECVSSRKPHTYKGLLHETMEQHGTKRPSNHHFSNLTSTK